MSHTYQVPHICELLLLLWSLLLTLLLLEWLWGHRSEVLAMTPRGGCAELHFWGFINVYPLLAPLHTFLSQGILFGDQRARGRNYCFLGWFCPNLCGAWVISPLQSLCSLSKLWCALLPALWLSLDSLFSGYCLACPGRLLEIPDIRPPPLLPGSGTPPSQWRTGMAVWRAAPLPQVGITPRTNL